MAMPNQGLHTIVLAGGPAEPEHLSAKAGVPTKALIPIAGRPMVAYVLEALARCSDIGPVTVVGLESSTLTEMATGHQLRHLCNHHSIVDNILAATEGLGDSTPVLIASADIPLLTSEAVTDFVRQAERSGDDLCYPIVERSVMEKLFPGSGRSFGRTGDGEFAGGDLFWVTPRLFRTRGALVREVVGQRKSIWGLARILGPGMLWRLATRRLTIDSLEARASKLLGCRCKAIISQHAELAMDVDKPHQLEMVQSILASQ